MAFKPVRSTTPPQPSTPAQASPDKWKLSSQLQKAIRQGKLPEALDAAEQLHALEPSYLRYRLAVIAVEDVAAGSPYVVLDTLGPGWKKAEVEARGGTHVVMETVTKFVHATKDRTPCNLMYATRFVQEFEALHGPMAQLSWERGLQVALDAEQPWWARALAGWRCAGTDKFKPRTNHIPDLTGNWDRWVAANGEAYGDDVAKLMRIGEFQREYHHLFLGLAHSANLTHTAKTVEGVYPDLPKLGMWLSSAIDKHTADGKRALYHLLAINPAGSQTLAQYGLDRDAQVDLIGRLWFWKEGSQCKLQREHAMSAAIHPDNQAKVLGPIPLSVLEDAFGNPELMQAARAKALGLNIAPPRTFRRG